MLGLLVRFLIVLCLDCLLLIANRTGIDSRGDAGGLRVKAYDSHLDNFASDKAILPFALTDH